MTTWTRIAFVSTFVAALGLACAKGEPNEGKRMPRLAPAPAEKIPEGVSIAVEIDGREAAPITTATLTSLTPDFADSQRRAWRFTTLVGEAAGRTGTIVAVTPAKASEIELRLPTNGSAQVPVLMISRRGDVIAELLDPSQPFPEFHGQGGRLGRPPEPSPRVTGVQRVRIFRPSSGPARRSATACLERRA